LIALGDEITFAQSASQLRADASPVQLAFELHAYVQEANWAFKLFNDNSAFLHARHAIHRAIAALSKKTDSQKSPVKRGGKRNVSKR